MAVDNGSVAVDDEESFFPIAAGELSLDRSPRFDIYVSRGADYPKHLFHQQNTPLTSAVLQRLSVNNATTVYVHNDQQADYYRDAENTLGLLLSDDSISTKEKSRIMYGASFNAVRDFFDNPDATDVLPRAKQVAENVVAFLTKEKGSFGHLMGNLSKDYTVYTHSVNVSIYSLSLAAKAGFTDEDYLTRLGTGTLLHDLGKSRIDPEVLHKEGKLNDEEWVQIKKHPEWGVEILKDRGVTDEMVLEITLNHHEKLNGKGYPNRLKAEDLPPYVRISTICDIFDALTTKRSYKEAISARGAMTIMKTQMEGELDSEYFRKMVLMMTAFNHWQSDRG